MAWQLSAPQRQLRWWPASVVLVIGLLIGSTLADTIPAWAGLGWIASGLALLSILLPERHLGLRQSALLTTGILVAWWWSPPQATPPPQLVQCQATVSRLLYRGHQQGVLLDLPMVGQRVYASLALTPPLRPGDRISVAGLLRYEPYRDQLRPRLRPGTWQLQQGREQGAQGWAWRCLDRLTRHQDLAASLLLGRGRPDSVQQFRHAGLAHVLAVSGLHVGIALLAVGLLLRGTSWWWYSSLLGSTALGYLWLTGGSVPTQRAVIMALALLAGLFSWRRAHPLAGWALAVLVLLLLDPHQAQQLGFQLSVAAVFGILTLGRCLLAWRRWLPLSPWPLDRPSWRAVLVLCRWSLDAVAVGLAASLATAPVLIHHLGHCNPWSPIATLLASLPLMLTLCGGLALILLAGIWPNGPWELVYQLTESGLHMLVCLAEWCASWPWAQVQAPAWSSLALLPLLALIWLPAPVWRHDQSNQMP